jgi:hypothetical protein
MRTEPILYSHKELNQPAKPINQKPIQTPISNPYQYALYNCGEASI